MAMDVRNALCTAIALHGESAVVRALEAAGLFVELSDRSTHAVKVATQALTCGDVAGVLVFRFPGLPGEAAGATFSTGDAALLLAATVEEVH